MGFTLDFVPSVGVMGEHQNIYYGVAYNGHGVVFGQTAGRIISELIAGESSELTNLFVVDHKIPYAGPRALRILFARLYKGYLRRWGSNTTR
jgi:glycine/D-amino acid oxidase-like deaminating enzyme